MGCEAAALMAGEGPGISRHKGKRWEMSSSFPPGTHHGNSN